MATNAQKNKKVRIGLLGLGDMGKVHARTLARMPTVDLTIASRRPDILKQVAEELGVEKTYTDYDALFADPNIDAVVIATACTEHEEHIIRAAKHKKHIWTEKPIAFSREAVNKAVNAVKEAGVLFQVGFMRRYDPAYKKAKRLIDEGVVGKPVMFRSSSRDPFWPEKQDGPGYNSTYLDFAPHDIDLARWLLRSEVKRVFAYGAALVYPKLEEFGDCDNAVVTLIMENGAMCAIDYSRNARYGYHVMSEVLGDKGALDIGTIQQTQLLVRTPDGVSHDVHPWYMDRFREAFEAEIEDFVTALLCGKDHLQPDSEDGRRATCVGLALVDSWKTGLPVDVDYS